MLIRFIGTIRSLFNDSPHTNDGPWGDSSGHGGGGLGVAPAVDYTATFLSHGQY